MKIGIVGLPNVGKSTLFNALTKVAVPALNYPFCTIDPSVGIVPVPDPRLTQLSLLSKSGKTIPAVVEFVDIAGLVKGASEGEGLGNKFLSHIKEVDAIAEVVRIFEDTDIIHVAGHIDPLHDIEVINLELVLADLETANRHLVSVERNVRGGEKEALVEQKALEKVKNALEAGKMAETVELSDEEQKAIKHLNLLTEKKLLYVLNRKNGAVNLDEAADERWQRLERFLEDSRAMWVKVDAGVEADMKDMKTDEKSVFRQELGVEGNGIDELIIQGYALLDLITFFTTGEKETRAWTIKRGSTAPLAGAAIHTDFKEKFIRAQVIFWKDLIEAGSYAKAREKGLIRTEGKKYVVQDGDVIEFLI